ncbi:MAG TPA: ABC transporter permease subunit [Microvirga sp.]
MFAGILPVFVAGAVVACRQQAGPMALGLTLAALVLMLAATGGAAERLLDGRPPAARVALGAGFWVALAALLSLTAEIARQGAPWLRLVGLGAGAAAVLGGAALGLFDSLSLMAEYRARMDGVHGALRQHLVLSGSALLLALLLALPLGWAAFHSRRVEAAANAALGAVQVTPAIALFGLLIPLLSALLAWWPDLRRLGLGAIGPAPALIGVAVYVALPLLRGLVAALRSVDPAILEAARAMGMTESRVTADVRLPLGLPILVGAVRVAAVQSIGLMTLGGLIGAGGLGAIVFEGMAQFAPDLILLGALPVVALALATDAGLGIAARRLEARVR